MSTDAQVQALLRDIQVRKWVDLQRADVAQGVGMLVAKALLTQAEADAILQTPVTSTEQRALVKGYFS
mgnify:CR=1 FL=1